MEERQKVWAAVQERLAKVNAELLDLADHWPRETDAGAIDMLRVAMGRIELLRQDAEFFATHLEISDDEMDLVDLTRRPEAWEANQ